MCPGFSVCRRYVVLCSAGRRILVGHTVNELMVPGAIHSVAAGKPVRELGLPQDCVLTAVIHKGEPMIPHGDLVLQPADETIALVHASQAPQLASLLAKARA